MNNLAQSLPLILITLSDGCWKQRNYCGPSLLLYFKEGGVAQWAGTQEMDSPPGNLEWLVSFLWASACCVADKGEGKGSWWHLLFAAAWDMSKKLCVRIKSDLQLHLLKQASFGTWFDSPISLSFCNWKHMFLTWTHSFWSVCSTCFSRLMVKWLKI